jgi:hypothetical protein
MMKCFLKILLILKVLFSIDQKLSLNLSDF